MSELSFEILQSLAAVQAERVRREADPALASKVHAVKRHQHHRFERTYADLLLDPGSAAAARFFLDDLYGPRDFSSRDQQFARIVPAINRLLPIEVMTTVLTLARLHALSESLDSQMAVALVSPELSDANYAAAWRAVGQREQRELQIQWMTDIGSELQRHTRSRMLRTSLRMMRGPAAAAGLGALQQFLEAGLDAFRELSNPAGFLATIAQRERQIALELFSAT